MPVRETLERRRLLNRDWIAGCGESERDRRRLLIGRRVVIGQRDVVAMQQRGVFTAANRFPTDTVGLCTAPDRSKTRES